ncbi:MAG: septation protein IspZ [Hyphomicrobiales bacterium]|nr:septation protein IspZ [Hyphomicrobiales bacterium]
MSMVFRRLAGDFFSTILFVVVWTASGSVLAATAVAIAGALAQFAWAKRTGAEMTAISYVSLALVVLLGGATLVTGDPRFVLVKPSLAHFGIGAIMLKKGWMVRYMPPRVLQYAPDLPVVAGYWWAALMIGLGGGVIATALTGNLRIWGVYIFIVAPAAKVVAFAIQYVVFRTIITRRVASARNAEAG